MHLYALILGIWLLPKGDTLMCYNCIPDILGNCTEKPIVCPSDNYQCGATRVIAYAGGSKYLNNNVTDCVLPEECGEGSGNSGDFNISVNTQCCNSNLCNNQSVPEPRQTPPNGRQCFTFDGSGGNKTLGCNGNEDYCGVGTVDVGGNTTTVKGCISKQLCCASVLSHLLKANITCANGYLCNRAVNTSAVTASDVTASAVTASAVTASAVTASAVTASAVTASAVTTSAVTTSAVNTSAVTTSAVTTSAVTARAVTASAGLQLVVVALVSLGLFSQEII